MKGLFKVAHLRLQSLDRPGKYLRNPFEKTDTGIPVQGGSSWLIMMSLAPDLRASLGISAAGVTARLEPTTINRSDFLEFSKDRLKPLSERGWPKPTTLETKFPPHWQTFSPRLRSTVLPQLT